jgi:hypothetical protein
MRLFLATNLGTGGECLDVNRDRVVEKWQPGEALHEAGMR